MLQGWVEIPAQENWPGTINVSLVPTVVRFRVGVGVGTFVGHLGGGGQGRGDRGEGGQRRQLGARAPQILNF